MKRNIVTMDGFELVIIDKCGSIYKSQMLMFARQFAEEEGIGIDGIGCVFREPIEGLRKWKPKT